MIRFTALAAAALTTAALLSPIAADAQTTASASIPQPRLRSRPAASIITNATLWTLQDTDLHRQPLALSAPRSCASWS